MTEIDRFRPVQPRLRSNPDRRRAGNETEIKSAESFSVVLFRPDLPEIDTSLGAYRLCRSRRGDFSNDAVDGPAATADYKHVLYNPVGGAGGDAGHVQLDLLAPRTVGIDRVAASLAASKADRAGRPEAIANVINLCETALAVKPPDAYYNLW